MASKQAKEFLSKNHEFTDQVLAFEKEFEVQDDLVSSKEFLSFLENADIPWFNHEVEQGEDGEFTGIAEYDDFNKPTCESASYFIDKESGRLAIECAMQARANIILYGKEHDYNWYEPPYYDESECTVVAYYLLYLYIPSNVSDFDAYDFEVDDEDSVEYEEE